MKKYVVILLILLLSSPVFAKEELQEIKDLGDRAMVQYSDFAKVEDQEDSKNSKVTTNFREFLKDKRELTNLMNEIRPKEFIKTELLESKVEPLGNDRYRYFGSMMFYYKDQGNDSGAQMNSQFIFQKENGEIKCLGGLINDFSTTYFYPEMMEIKYGEPLEFSQFFDEDFNPKTDGNLGYDLEKVKEDYRQVMREFGYLKDEYLTRGEVLESFGELWERSGETLPKDHDGKKDIQTWAIEHKILKGYVDKDFGLQKAVTQEELATFVYRYMNVKKKDLLTEKGSQLEHVSPWARNAVAYGMEKGFFTLEDFSPKAYLERDGWKKILEKLY
ncbi:MAG: S-layer homology domain-containing protein [Tissierellia bacterium]|nr:S-layer homology domain-containing protein [Tissierellia bacterium]